MSKKHHIHRSRRVNAERVKAVLRQWYEPGRNDRCKLWVFREKIEKPFGISESTFWRYQREIDEEMGEGEDKSQLSLF
jgi:hypothetical protein